MNRIEKLYEANKDKLVIREKGVTPIQVIKGMVDIQELPLNTLYNIRIKLLKENVAIIFEERNMPFKEDDVTFHLYEILKNKKSQMYYEELENQQKSPRTDFFEDKTVFFVLEDHIGLMETNSNIFWKDFSLAYGITERDLQEKNITFMDYITHFDPERYNPPHTDIQEEKPLD